MASVLFIHGGDEHARALYRDRRSAYWTAALPLALEKHGFLDLEVDPDPEHALARSWDDYAAVLVGALDESLWTAPVIERVVSSDVPVLVESPLAPQLASALGIVDEGRLDLPARVDVSDAALLRATERYGWPAGGVVGEAVIRKAVGTEPGLRWPALANVGISEEQAQAWAEQAWQFHAWRDTGRAEVLATWTQEDVKRAKTRPALIRAGNVFVTAFPLFAYLGRAHTSIPRSPEETASFPRVTGLEVMLLAVVDRMHGLRGRRRVRVAPWPTGVNWVRNVRLDFDRPLTIDAVRRVLAAHNSAGSAATWYWRAEPRYRGDRFEVAPEHLVAAAVVAGQPAHEVALHTERPYVAADRERAVVEAAIGRPVRGTSAHGADNCFRYQGAPSVLWADREQLEYTELLEHGHFHPHRFATLDPDGVVRPLRILCVPHHVSFDAGVGGTHEEAVQGVMRYWIRVSGFLQIMNHPDINQEDLMRVLASHSREGRADWTAAAAIDWWRRTHVPDALSVGFADSDTVVVESREDVQGLVLEVLHPDGKTERLDVDLQAGVRMTVPVSK